MRLFIAIQFPERIKNALAYLQQDMKDCGMKGNYTKEENFHLTLAFIGEYSDTARVLSAMRTVPFKPFEVVTLRIVPAP